MFEGFLPAQTLIVIITLFTRSSGYGATGGTPPGATRDRPGDRSYSRDQSYAGRADTRDRRSFRLLPNVDT